MAVARRIILGCDMVDGHTAERLGLVQWSAPDEELGSFCNSLTTRIAGLSAAALAASKRCLVKTEASIAPGLDAELAETLSLLDTADTQTRVRAFLDARGAK
jgi:enoyl-CoA hydratase/carnithine racemase